MIHPCSCYSRPSFYILSTGAHRKLPSFPTRRSSDLVHRPRRRFSGSVHRRADCSAASPDEPRSEEHTSELQSRPHLVCRLLLEKKKSPVQRQSYLLSLHLTSSSNYSLTLSHSPYVPT